VGSSHYAGGVPHKPQNYGQCIYGKSEIQLNSPVNRGMETDFLIAQGNQHRADYQYEEALRCYALAFTQDRTSAAAFNNYGNVLREMGYPDQSLPFLQHAIVLDPDNITAKFNLAVSYLLMGDYQRGWPAYETRWQYEHLVGTEPQFAQPRWRGESLRGKTILVVGEQGHGDNIQFVRFLYNLHLLGAKLKLQATDGLIPLLSTSKIIEQIGRYTDDMGDFDYWVPIMSIPGVIGITLENMAKPVNYLNADPVLMQQWLTRLGPKTGMRVGISWSGRKDSWLNQHKSMPFQDVVALIQKNPQYEWINLQVDASAEEIAVLEKLGVRMFPNTIYSFNDTAALLGHMDLVVSVDTAVAHLAGALGRPLWLMLNKYSTDWRWLLNRDNSPWYSTARLFRQSEYGNWANVIDRVTQFLSWFKI